MRTISVLPSLLIASLLSLPAGVASAATYESFSGQTCQAMTSTYDAETDYYTGGTGNYDDSAGARSWYFCPVTGIPVSSLSSTSVNLDGARAYVYDGNDVIGVKCEIHVQTQSGGTYFSTALYSCTTAGGCTTETGLPDSAHAYLEWTGAELPNGGSSIANVAALSLKCAIPSRKGDVDDGTLVESWLESYVIQYY